MRSGCRAPRCSSVTGKAEVLLPISASGETASSIFRRTSRLSLRFSKIDSMTTAIPECTEIVRGAQTLQHIGGIFGQQLLAAHVAQQEGNTPLQAAPARDVFSALARPAATRPRCRTSAAG